MDETGALDRLAAHYGIEPGFSDNWGRHQVIPAATKRALLAAMGVPVGERCRARGEPAGGARRRAWREVLPPVAVVRERRRRQPR